MNYKIARIISDIFVPPTFTLIAFIILGISYETEVINKIIVISSGAFFGFILPIIFFLFLRKKGKVINNDATIKEERTFPYFVGILFCTVAFFLLFLTKTNVIAYSLWLSYIVNTFLLILINRVWKISAHAIGASTFLGLLVYLLGAYGLLFVPLLIIIGIARLYLKVHTPMQVLMGSLFGFILTYLQLVLYSNLL